MVDLTELRDVAADGPPEDPAARIVGPSVAVTSVAHDSRAVRPGALFACLRGAAFDGHRFAADAVAAGAVALLVDHELNRADVASASQLVVDDTRLRLGPIAATVAGHPSRRLRTVGITGTNGKTTTAHMLAAIFEADGQPTGVVGTLHGPRTTPEAPELQATLASFVDRGDRAAVLEVSSHALALHRIDGTEFDAVLFTNFGHDHLDLHGTPEEYFRAKASLFTSQFAPVGVINVDDPHGRLLADTAVTPEFEVVPYTSGDVTDLRVSTSSHSYMWQGRRVEVPLGGQFNVANSLAALTVAARLGVPADAAVEGLAGIRPVPGRFEVVGGPRSDRDGYTVVVDYAHTPEGLTEVLRSARDVAPVDGRVIVVFGCGGGRDREKRPDMGAVAARYADVVIVTSDNPRHEDPQAIIDDVVEGVPDEYRARVTSNPDRRAAIREALDVAGEGDLVVLAGKGHEQTQDLGGETIDFDDRVVVRTLLEDLS